MERRERPYDPFIARMQSRRLFDWRAPPSAEKPPEEKEKEQSDWAGWLAQFWKTVAIVYVSTIAFGILAYGVYDLLDDALHRRIIIEPIAVPKALVDKGYSPESAARQFREALLKIRRSSGGPTEDVDVDMKRGDDLPNISAPGLGVPLESVAAMLHALKRFGPNPTISGEVVYVDNKLRLKLFKNGSEAFPQAVADDIERPDRLMEAAAQEYMRQTDPLTLSIYLSATRPDKAIAVARSVIERLPEAHPTAAKAHDVLGDLLRQAPRVGCKGLERTEYLSRLNKALSEYERAIQFAPDFARPHNGRGLVLAESNRYEDAKQAFEKAIAISPGFAAPYNNLGVYKRRYEGNRNDPKLFDDVMANYRKAIELDPGDGLHHYNYGLVLYEVGRKDEAIAEFKKAIQFAPGFASPHILLGRAMRDYRRQPDDAVAEFDRAFEVDHCSALARYHKGLTLQFDLQNFNDALVEYDNAAQIDANFAEPAYFRGYLYYCNRSDPKSAVDSFAQAVQRAPANAWYKFSLGAALLDAGRKDEADRAIREAAAKTSDRAEIHNFLGETLLTRNDPQGARKEFLAAIALDPRDGVAYHNIGKVLRSEHNMREALENFRRAVEIAPDEWENHADLAALLSEQGQSAEAERELSRAKELKAKLQADTEKRSRGWKALCMTKPQY
jgi:tetratricopeptide (TPR) repeat protein